MSLTIYMYNAYYITRVSLLGWLVVWTSNLLVWGSNPISNKSHFQACTVAHWLHCSAFDLRWPVLTMRYIRKNRRYIVRYRWFLGISHKISPDRYFSMKYHVDPSRYTIYQQYIAIFSSLEPTNVNQLKKYYVWDHGCKMGGHHFG